MTAMRTTTRTRGQRFEIDCERFRAQLLHFMRVYGWNANTLGQAVIGHPSRVYRYLDGRTNPTIGTCRRFRAFMRRYRQSIKI